MSHDAITATTGRAATERASGWQLGRGGAGPGKHASDGYTVEENPGPGGQVYHSLTGGFAYIELVETLH